VRRFSCAALVAAVGLAAGCSGSSTPVAPTMHASPGTVANAKRATTTLTFAIPRRAGAKRYAIGKRKPKYVSPSTSGMIASMTNPDYDGGATQYQGYTLSAGITATAASPASCGAAGADGFTCTIFLDLPPDAAQNYTVTLTAYDVAQSGTAATPADGSNALSTDTESFTVVADTANTVAFTLEGIVRGFYATRQNDGIPNTAASYTLTFLPLDADGNPINDSAPLAYYNGSTFVENATFNVAATDVNDLPGATTPVYAISGTPAITSGSTGAVTVTYDGQSSPGTFGTASTSGPGYGSVTVSAPADYVGYNSAGYAATATLLPFFPAVDQTNALASGPATVAFTQSGQTITAYGIQANAVSNSAGYSVDDSDCSGNANYGNIADAGPLSPNLEPAVSNTAFGTMFTIMSGSPSLVDGMTSANLSCVIRIYDDSYPTPQSGVLDEADISVNFAYTIATDSGARAPAARNRGRRGR
jgi:hypothetical protein